jgi:V/A-type H+-transporting ATPase subunit E
MTEDISGLIQKIKEEGVNAAQEKASQIEKRSKEEAEKIIQKAQQDAEKILSKAKEEVKMLEDSSKALLKQAARDLLLNLRKEINAALDKIISIHVQQALSSSELIKIIDSLIKDYCGGQVKGNIVITLNKADLEKLQKSFLGELKADIKKGLAIKASDDISAGFTISYDSGKSCFDFTDRALAEYIGSHLKPKLAEILK